MTTASARWISAFARLYDGGWGLSARGCGSKDGIERLWSFMLRIDRLCWVGLDCVMRELERRKDIHTPGQYNFLSLAKKKRDIFRGRGLCSHFLKSIVRG